MLGQFTWPVVFLLVGIVLGVTLFPWLRSPFSPGLWKLATPFARVLLTVAQFLRPNGGILVKRANGRYEIGTYDPDAQEAILHDKRVSVEPERTKWGLFGKQPFGITWEPGTDLHNRVRADVAADGGEEKLGINMAAAHRILRGANDSEAINRTEEHAKAEYGGGADGLSDMSMAILIMVMLLLGSFMGWFMLG